jgi:hypothetical protein
MPESLKAPDGERTSRHLRERAESLLAQTTDTFQKMTTLSRAVGIASLVAITLLCYLAKGKIFKKR